MGYWPRGFGGPDFLRWSDSFLYFRKLYDKFWGKPGIPQLLWFRGWVAVKNVCRLSPAGWLPRTGTGSGTLRSVIEYGLPVIVETTKDLSRPLRGVNGMHPWPGPLSLSLCFCDCSAAISSLCHWRRLPCSRDWLRLRLSRGTRQQLATPRSATWCSYGASAPLGRRRDRVFTP